MNWFFASHEGLWINLDALLAHLRGPGAAPDEVPVTAGTGFTAERHPTEINLKIASDHLNVAGHHHYASDVNTNSHTLEAVIDALGALQRAAVKLNERVVALEGRQS